MDLDDSGVKRRGRGRGSRARGRGARARGRGRGKKAAVIVSDEEISLDQSFDSLNANAEDIEMVASTNVETNEDAIMHEAANKENELTITTNITAASSHEINTLPNDGKGMGVNDEQRMQAIPPVAVTQLLPQTIDMEADISQLEAPTFTTISRGPPEPMLRLKWDHKVNLMGDKVLNPMIHCCDQCDKPILVYGRMIPCKHVFCLKCARTEPIKVCPRCNDKVIRVEQTGLGTVFMCSHGGSRYGHLGCRRTYLSQRDLQAHINHRHVTQITQATAEMKVDHDIDALKSVIGPRKLSESNTTSAIQMPSAMLAQRPPPLRSNSLIGIIAPPGSTVNNTVVSSSSHSSHSSLTQANLARVNTANAQDCHQGKAALHQTLKKTSITQSHHQQPETVADASYYSSVLNSFGSANSGGN